VKSENENEWVGECEGEGERTRERESEHTKRTFFIVMFQGHPVCLDENVFFKKRERRKENVFRENEKLCVQCEAKKLLGILVIAGQRHPSGVVALAAFQLSSACFSLCVGCLEQQEEISP
jgi:hypothetical protein